MAGVVGAISRFLGLTLPTDQRVTPGERRQADDINDDKIRRYRALHS